ncbi:MAG: hypothetical protein Q8873_01900 [Bacillota bacterium]|nr:hypothetical protein [Bacillota bacterium]
MKNFSTGIITGVVIGAVAGMILDPISDKRSRNIKKTARGVFSYIGNAMDYMIGS